MSSDTEYKDEIVVEIKPNQTLNLQLKAKKKEWTLKGAVSDSATNNKIGRARVDLYQTKVKLTKPLKCFKEPSTTSATIAELDRFEYSVVEIKLNHPDNDTDYIKILSPDFEEGEGWICSRWKESHYALLYDKKVQGGIATTSATGEFDIKVNEKQLYRFCFVLEDYFDATSDRILAPNENIDVEMLKAENNIKESYIIDLIPHFSNFSYTKGTAANPARYPYDLPNVGIDKAPPRKNNCCTFVEGLIVKAWKDALTDDFSWSLAKHEQMMIQVADNFAPVTAIVEKDMGIEITDADKLPPAWTIVQGWDSGYTKGHTFLIVDVHPDTERILTLESNNWYCLNGPGFRKLGDIDEFENYNPGYMWWKESRIMKWSEFKNIYPNRKMAQLKVYDLQWLK